MPHDTIKERGRITARVPQSIQEKLQAAADSQGATLNQFIVQSALEKAEKIIDRQTTISLTQRDATTLLAMLENPSQPNAALLRAFERYKNKVKDGLLHSNAGQGT
jgi:uncharacterized protein (DUF1778 family)